MTSATPLSATASCALPTGTRLGEFEITGVLGEGGFGIVYSAHDASLDRIVAIKEYLPSALSYRDHQATVQIKSDEHSKTFAAGLASFVNEARLLASFSHPALVEVFRFWQANGTAYMAMRYYPGKTLQALLRATPQVATEAWLRRTLDPILLALGELHAQQCYHRDIAPDNIMVLPDGRSVLMDFGAARRIIGGMSQAVTSVLKPGYAPIEQYAHDGAIHQGAWTDVYAVGGVLYQAMTGQTPVQAIARMATDPLVAVATLSGQTSHPAYSDQLCACVMKSMAVQPAGRFQTIQALRAALGWDQVSAPPSTVALGFDPLATVVLTRPGINTAAPAAGTFDPQATVVLARPPTGPVTGMGATTSAPLPQTPAADKAEAAPTPRAMPPKTKTGLWAALVATGVTLAIGLIYYLGKPDAAAPSPQVATASPPLPTQLPAEPAKAAAPTPPGQPAPADPAPAPAQPPPVATSASASVQPTAPVISPEPTAITSNPANPTTSTPEALPTTGVLRIEVKGGWAAVFVNGEDKGVTPPLLGLKLPPGSYDIELRNPALPTIKRTAKVLAGKTATLRHSFVKDPPAEPSVPTPASPAKSVTTY